MYLLLLAPFVTSIILFFIPKSLSKISGWLGTFAVMSNLVVLATLYNLLPIHEQISWANIGVHPIKIGVRIDKITFLMLSMVNLVSVLVHLFSLVYMEKKDHKRYFGFLSLFTASIIGLLLSDNLLGIYIFWELVGFCSFLLIGFWYQKPKASAASKKAFLVNRIGDLFFLIGIILYYIQFQTFRLPTADMLGNTNTTLIMMCLFGGCIAKSAQFPLHIWLPDAMLGPTPASALIHAATMVAAGIYLLARIFVLHTEETMLFISIIGTITSLIGALTALQQTDLKKVLAYSTISQLGLMVLGMGVGALEASLMHLFTHAFFKAGLFLTAGAIIHYLHKKAYQHDVEFDAQDMRLMGGLREKLPIPFITYTICMLALVGFPLTSGFLSKDALLLHSIAWAKVAYENTGIWMYFLIPITAWASVLLTALYMGRQWILVFWGESRLKTQSNITFHQQIFDWKLHLPLLVLAIGSIGFVFSYNPFDVEVSWLYQLLTPKALPPMLDALVGKVSVHTNNWHVWASIISTLLSTSGLGLAFYLYTRAISPSKRRLAIIMKNGFYINKWYEVASKMATFPQYNTFLKSNNIHYLVILPTLTLSTFLVKVEQKVINTLVGTLAKAYVVFAHIVAWADHFFVDGTVRSVYNILAKIGNFFSKSQKGSVQKYIVLSILLIILLPILIWIII